VGVIKEKGIKAAIALIKFWHFFSPISAPRQNKKTG